MFSIFKCRYTRLKQNLQTQIEKGISFQSPRLFIRHLRIVATRPARLARRRKLGRKEGCVPKPPYIHRQLAVPSASFSSFSNVPKARHAKGPTPSEGSRTQRSDGDGVREREWKRRAKKAEKAYHIQTERGSEKARFKQRVSVYESSVMSLQFYTYRASYPSIASSSFDQFLHCSVREVPRASRSSG